MFLVIKVYMYVTLILTLVCIIAWAINKTKPKKSFKQALPAAMSYSFLWLPLLGFILYEAVTGKESWLLKQISDIEKNKETQQPTLKVAETSQEK